MKKIRLKPKQDRRFRSGHPWVYSNELQESPKTIEAGQPLELLDASGKFLAFGYGNPSSLITFRSVSRDQRESDAVTSAGVARRLDRAWRLRCSLGFSKWSHRLCFGEADLLPGLIVDRYVLAGQKTVLVVQAQTAGADRWVKHFDEVLNEWRKINPLFFREGPSVVIKNDSASRRLEGLSEEAGRILSDSDEIDLSQSKILVRSADFTSAKPVEFWVDFIEGQKTGFFLDQWANISLVIQRLDSWLEFTKMRKVRVLDLCCYVGQWSLQLSKFFERRGIEAEFTLVDSSSRALAQAKKNMESTDGPMTLSFFEGNVLQDLGQLSDRSQDVVISDPPALIKSRKDIPVGTHAYLQLHTQAARLLSSHGVWAACSCSGLLSEESFTETLLKATRRQSRSVSWVSRGGQSPDHPVLGEFPEGRYLKSLIGLSID